MKPIDMSIPMATMSNGNGSTIQINTRPDDIQNRIVGGESKIFLTFRNEFGLMYKYFPGYVYVIKFNEIEAHVYTTCARVGLYDIKYYSSLKKVKFSLHSGKTY